MNNTGQEIQKIVFEEFSLLVENIESDFKKNYLKKRYNFLLNQMDETVIANMVFVSSFESKSGFALEACAKRIAALKFGAQNVPTVVNPHGIKHDIKIESVKGQIIVTDIDIENGDLRGEISAFRANNIAKGKGKTRTESEVTQTSIKHLLTAAKRYKGKTVYIKPVDLAFFDGDNWNILELKAGGDLDSSNAPSNVEKLLTEYVALNNENAKIFFATLYNKNGEGKAWTGTVKKHLAYPEMFLIGKDFWNVILPDGIDFEIFTSLYKAALEDISLNKRIKEMIKRTSA